LERGHHPSSDFIALEARHPSSSYSVVASVFRPFEEESSQYHHLWFVELPDSFFLRVVVERLASSQGGLYLLEESAWAHPSWSYSSKEAKVVAIIG